MRRGRLWRRAERRTRDGGNVRFLVGRHDRFNRLTRSVNTDRPRVRLYSLLHWPYKTSCAAMARSPSIRPSTTRSRVVLPASLKKSLNDLIARTSRSSAAANSCLLNPSASTLSLSTLKFGMPGFDKKRSGTCAAV